MFWHGADDVLAWHVVWLVVKININCCNVNFYFKIIKAINVFVTVDCSRKYGTSGTNKRLFHARVVLQLNRTM